MKARLRTIQLWKLRLPGDFKKLLQDVNVLALAESIRDHGLIHEPLVRSSDWRVVVGMKRIAALHLLGRERIEVKDVECTDQEAAVMRYAENLYRTYETNTAEVALQLAAAIEAKLTQFPAFPRSRGKKGSRKALEIAAKVTGYSEGYLNNVASATKRKRGPILKPIGAAEPSALIEGGAFALYHQLADAKDKLQEAREAIRKCGNYAKQSMIDCIDQLDREIEGLFPSQLCPWCKGMIDATPTCLACDGRGFISEAQQAGVPTVLVEEPLKCYDKNGRMRDYPLPADEIPLE